MPEPRPTALPYRLLTRLLRGLLPGLLPGLLLAGCASDPGFPSLLPRPGEASRDLGFHTETASEPSEAERALLADTIGASDARLAEAIRAVESAGKLLDRALAEARGARAGEPAWMAAHIAWSRFEEARSALGRSRGELTALLLRTDAFASDDPQRAKVQTLVSALSVAEAVAASRVAMADSTLAPPR